MSWEPSRLQREIKQTRPFPSRSQEVTVALLRTADVVRRHVSEVLDPHDLTAQQYNVLRILRGAGAAGLPTLEIASRMVEHAPGITRLLDRLETKGLVERERCKVDRRQVLCHITRAGLSLLALLDEPIHDADRKAVGSLVEKDLDDLLRILDSLRAACTGETPCPDFVQASPARETTSGQATESKSPPSINPPRGAQGAPPRKRRKP